MKKTLCLCAFVVKIFKQMKKTFTVNVNGIVFHIDEDAYNVLNDYLSSIKKHFSKTEGRDEIISDIEARIAEMLQENINGQNQVITIEHIEKVIEVIGLPSEFEGEEAFEDNNNSKSKRLYRDPDNTMIAGVCSGLGNYFHSDPAWFRLIFVLAVVFGVGTGLIVYLILWIVVPEAKSTAEKLEMKGEKVNLSNIENSIKEEIEKLKDKFNDFSEEAKNTFKKKSVTHKSDLDNIANLFAQILNIFVRLVLIFVGIVISIIGISVLLAFFISMFEAGWYFLPIEAGYSSFSLDNLSELILGNNGSNVFFKAGLFLFIGIPLIMILYTGIRLIFGFKRVRYTGTIVFYFWLAGLLLTSFYTYKVGKEFRQQASFKQETVIGLPQNSPLYLTMDMDNIYGQEWDYNDEQFFDEMDYILTDNDEKFFLGKPCLYIKKAPEGQNGIKLEIDYSSHGKTEKKAIARGKDINYKYDVQDSLITFKNYFSLSKGDHWRHQNVKMYLIIPEGVYVHFGRQMYEILRSRHHSAYNLSGETWLMTDSGLEKAEFIPEEKIGDMEMDEEELGLEVGE